MILERITTLDDPRLQDFTSLTDVALRRLLETDTGLYLAESEKVIARAIQAGHVPRAVLLTEQWLSSLQPLLEHFVDLPVFIGNTEELEQLTGFHMHRGAIASMNRPALPTLDDVLRDAQTIVILENLVDHTNVGAIFRTAAALGADAVLVSERCADPLYRRSVRVSMGSVLQVPWTRLGDWNAGIDTLHGFGFEVAALALTDEAIPLSEYVSILKHTPRKVAMLLGSEGDGLSRRAVATADIVVKIPMHHGVDSLNVSNAASIALWAVCGK